MRNRTEDQVRDGAVIGSVFVPGAKQILGFDKPDADVKAQQGTGQITTFNQLGFSGIDDKPDGWYLPSDIGSPAIILETKGEKVVLNNKKWVKELFKNIDVVSTKYSKIVGILYNGIDVRVFKGHEELFGLSKDLEHKSYYIKLFTEQKIDKQHIYEVTQRINNLLHFKFGLTDLQDRMIFTACALVAQRYGARLEGLKDRGWSIFHTSIHSTLSKSLEADRKQNAKVDILLEEYSNVRMSITEDQKAINSFIDNVCEISDLVNSDYWNGEDVMAIFFNEFNRYRGKADAGQVFTPDHITSFMYRLIGVTKDDRVLDATCGSGAFLVKAMCNMIKEAGGVGTNKAAEIKKERLFGIEMYRKVFALACANMLIHKDGKTNLEQMDAMSTEAADWIRSKNITKVLMNPPYERKYGCLKIVKNVLDSVPMGTLCSFILPDKKLEKDDKTGKLLKGHTLQTVVKLPENLFFGIGVTTSVFVFEAGKPQNGKTILGYYIEDDGLETVKNQGRQDIKDRWREIENYWIEAIATGEDSKFGTKRLINPAEHRSYPSEEKPFEIYEEDFMKTVMDYLMFQEQIDVKEFRTCLADKVLYSEVPCED